MLVAKGQPRQICHSCSVVSAAYDAPTKRVDRMVAMNRIRLMLQRDLGWSNTTGRAMREIISLSLFTVGV